MAEKITFPEDFLWGVATSSYQIEGAVDEDGRGKSIWDTFSETPGKVKNGENGAVACDHYHLYREDIALIKGLGVDAYRFSIAWPRILPEGTGQINEAGLDFYDRLVDELLENDLEPWPTLYHWDLPQTLEDAGGWPVRSIVDAFVSYADVVTKLLGDRVKNWMTFNEPWVFTFLGYGNGIHAPGRQSFPDYLHAVHHMFLAHARSVPLMKQNGAEQVGIVLNLTWSDPATDSDADKAAVERSMGFQNRWFLDPLYRGGYPDDMLKLYQNEMGLDAPHIEPGDMEEIQIRPDFLGINFYTRGVIANDPDGTGLAIKTIHQDQSEHTAMGWEVSPQSIYDLLVHTHQGYAPGTLYITENGAAFDDEVAPDGEIHDERRVNFYKHYLANCHKAIQDGVPLKGYFAWSLMDNFEWAEGYDMRFGIVRVDFETQQRTLKDSAKWYRETVTNNGFEL